jgi:pSer/pThr/pTyr-binding forkhead associated (FHA) protein
VTAPRDASAWLAEKKLGREKFLAQYRIPFLVCLDWEAAQRRKEDEIADENVLFRTGIATAKDLTKPAPPDLKRALILEVAKTDRNPYQKIYIGRAANCDLVLQHHTVSKLHAHLTILNARDVEICDLGSRNGTFHSGERLDKGQTSTMRPGDELVVGRVPLTYLDPSGFFDLLSR